MKVVVVGLRGIPNIMGGDRVTLSEFVPTNGKNGVRRYSDRSHSLSS